MGYLESVDDVDEIHPPVLEALRKIPDPDRKILELIYYEELGYEEVSKEIGLSKERVKGREASGIEKLADTLRSYSDTEAITSEEAKKAIRLSGERIAELSKKSLTEEEIETAKEEIEEKIRQHEGIH